MNKVRTKQFQAGSDGQVLRTESGAAVWDNPHSFTTVSGNYTVTDESTLLCNASGGAFTVNLPAAASMSGRSVRLKKTDSSSNAITIDPNGSETIDGQAQILISVQYDALHLASDGSQWLVISDKGSTGSNTNVYFRHFLLAGM